jgi:hypothetical protein
MRGRICPGLGIAAAMLMDGLAATVRQWAVTNQRWQAFDIDVDL